MATDYGPATTSGQDSDDLRLGHTSREPAEKLGGAGYGAPHGFTVGGFSGDQAHPGYPDASDTYRWGDQGTQWPMDAFTEMVAAGGNEAAISTPAAHSYAGDDNMDAYQIVGPYAVGNERTRDLGMFTGATGPSGHVTPMNQPELTAPASPSTLQDTRPGGHPDVR